MKTFPSYFSIYPINIRVIGLVLVSPPIGHSNSQQLSAATLCSQRSLQLSWMHRLNMELDLQSLFRLLCTAVHIGWHHRRQSAKLFLQSSELGLSLPQPLTRRRVCPPPSPGSGGSGTLAGERGVGRVPIPTRGHTLWYSLFIYTYFVADTPQLPPSPRTWAHIWGRYWSAKIDDISLQPPGWMGAYNHWILRSAHYPPFPALSSSFSFPIMACMHSLRFLHSCFRSFLAIPSLTLPTIPCASIIYASVHSLRFPRPGFRPFSAIASSMIRLFPELPSPILSFIPWASFTHALVYSLCFLHSSFTVHSLSFLHQSYSSFPDASFINLPSLMLPSFSCVSLSSMLRPYLLSL
jgi:hypothetical protein